MNTKLLLIISLTLVSCGQPHKTKVVDQDGQQPSFAHSGGFYAVQAPQTDYAFSFEKWMPKVYKELDIGAVSRFREQKDLKHFTILSMAWHGDTFIRNFTKTPEYVQFLEIYSEAINLGLVDYLNVGEENDYEVKTTTADLRARFPNQKIGSWPGRPQDLVVASDFYLFDDYRATKEEDFQFLLATGKPVILVLNATPSLATTDMTKWQAEFARKHDLPVIFFAVGERNSYQDYYNYHDREDFALFYQVVEDVQNLQLKLRE